MKKIAQLFITSLLLIILLIGCNLFSNAKTAPNYTKVLMCEDDLTLSQYNYTIEYGTYINVEAINETGGTANWEVKGDALYINGTGNSTGNIEFKMPGNYTVTFTAKDKQGKTHNVIATVKVVPVKVVFDVSKAVFSTPLIMGELSNATVTIPVEVMAYDKLATFNYGNTSTSVTGIDGLVFIHSSIEQLPTGKHVLKFVVQGTPNSAGQAQIGFFNPLGEGAFLNFTISSN